MNEMIYENGEVEVNGVWFSSIEELTEAKGNFAAYAQAKIENGHPGFLTGIVEDLADKAAALGCEWAWRGEKPQVSKGLLGGAPLFALGR